MAARYLRKRTLEVTDSDVQNSAFVVVRKTQSISVVKNNDNSNHMSAQMQGMLAGVLSTLNNIQSQNSKQINNYRGADKFLAYLPMRQVAVFFLQQS